MSRTPHRWWPHEVTTEQEPATSPTANPNVTESARTDRVLYSPTGEELVRIKDRPFRGYRAEEPM